MKRLGDEQTALIDYQRQTAAFLPIRPANPLLAQLEFVSCGAPHQQRHPLALVLRDVAQLFADKLRAVQIMGLGNELIEPLAFIGLDEAHLDTFKKCLLRLSQNRPVFRFHRPC